MRRQFGADWTEIEPASGFGQFAAKQARRVDVKRVVGLALDAGFEITRMECFLRGVLLEREREFVFQLAGTDQEFSIVGSVVPTSAADSTPDSTTADPTPERIHARVIDFDSANPRLELIP